MRRPAGGMTGAIRADAVRPYAVGIAFRLREVAAGTWRNPGASPAAQAINSLPEKHSGALAGAIIGVSDPMNKL